MGPRIKANGTAFFVDTGISTFGITANHVLDGLQQERNRCGKNVLCQVGDDIVDPLERRSYKV